jgi:hypothetical protein
MVGRKQVIGMWAAGIEGREGSTRGPARSVIPFRTGGFLGSEVRARQTTLEKKNREGNAYTINPTIEARGQ